MRTYKHAILVLVLAAATFLLSACGTSTNSSSVTTTAAPPTSTPSGAPTRPTLTASRLQPPTQDNKYTRSSSRGKVEFDPCTWIPDDAIQRIGYDPSTRQRGPDIVAEYTFLTCEFTNSDGALQIDSGNITLEEDRNKYSGKTEDVNINGRDAVRVVNKGAGEGCDIDMRTRAGFVGVGVIVDTKGRMKGLKPCDHIFDIATTLEPYIGKDN
jgi:hypothetical protein